MSEERLAAGLERRKEDFGLITGQARFVDDLRPPKGRPQALYMAVVRSPYAHAAIESIRLDAALALPGCCCCLCRVRAGEWYAHA